MPSSAPSGSSLMQDREQRKKMIEDYYQKVLGREVNQTDLNFFLNRGTSELELIKKMLDSQEHADLLAAKAELEKLKTEHSGQTEQLRRLEATVNDMRHMLKNLNSVITHKNRALAKLEELIHDQHGLPSGVVQKKREGKAPDTKSTTSSVKLPESVTERVFRKLVKVLF